MNIDRIDCAIKEVCLEVDKSVSSKLDWHTLSEEDMLFEVAVCIFGSQTVYEMSVAMANQIREVGLLRKAIRHGVKKELVQKIEAQLLLPVKYEVNGARQSRRPRFNKRLALLIGQTIEAIYGSSLTIKELLIDCNNSKEAREILVQYVSGFGPKQASLFLRRIGYCSELAVLDVHILDYLELKNGRSNSMTKLSNLSFYEQIELEFQKIAFGFGHSVGSFDLATWITMRVAKREGLAWA